MSRTILISLLLLITAGQLVQGQNTPPVVKQPYHSRIDEQGNKLLPPLLYKDETPDQRKARLGTGEDPGPDPDPETKWLRFGKLYTIQKFPRIHSTYDQDRGFVRPLWYVNVAKEVYDETEEFVWVWMNETEIMDQDPSLEDPSSEDAPAPYMKYNPEGLKYVLQVKEEFSTIRPARTDRIVRFRESSQGLPAEGSWRNGLDVADMNNDGLMDLIIPPQRGGVQGMFPFIFLGDGKGGWKVWREVQWSTSLNYGSVVAGDLNADGNQDLVFGVHLQGVVALLGDGKGNFTNASEGLPRNDFPTRRVALRDMDNDKDLDIVVITEGATMSAQSASKAPLRVYRNEKGAKSWKLDPVAEDARQVAGDWLSVGDFNGDKRQDIAGASIIFHGTDLIYLGDKNNQWKPFGRGWLPFYSYYGPSAAMKMSSTRRDDLILTFSRVWPAGANPDEIPPPEFQRVIGIERVVFDGKEPRRVPVARWEGRKPVGALATGDFDGDRNHDIIYWDSGTRGAVILLGDGKGGFKEAAIEGMTFPKNTLYDIKVADVNADKKPDVLVMFESGGGVKRDGSVRVFLNESGMGSARAEKKVATRN